MGQALQYFDTTVQADTSFGTTTSYGISDIAGQPANVMLCNPSTIGTANWGGFIMPHGMGPNGGGTNVNQYTVILDLLYAELDLRLLPGALADDPGRTQTMPTRSSTETTVWASASSITGS